MTHTLSQPLTASLTPSQAHTPYEAPMTTGRLTEALTGLTGPLLAASDPTHAHATRRIFDADSRPIHTHLAPTGSHGLSDALDASHVPTVPRAHRTAHRPLYGSHRPLAEPSEPYACTLRA